MKDLTSPPVSLIRVISTEGVGDMFNFTLTSSGNAGYVSIYLFFAITQKMDDPREKFADPRCCAHHGREHPPEELADGACNPDLPRKGWTSQDFPS